MTNINKSLKVSVICMTFNQEKYISDALHGFVSQKTDFPYEVIVHDDASADNTPQLILDYQKKYPDIIKPMLEEENQYSKGVDILRTIAENVAKGEYIAICEGDDYWTDPYKLQKQYDAMEQHPAIDMCAHAVEMINSVNSEKTGMIAPKEQNCILTVEDVIKGGGGYLSTNSLFFKKNVLSKNYQFRRKLLLDYTLQIAGALDNGILYLNECMAVYRQFSVGSWSENNLKSKQKIINLFTSINNDLKILDEETDHKYSTAVQYAVLANEFDILAAEEKYRDMISSRYSEIYKKRSSKERRRIMAKAMFPHLLMLHRSIKKNLHKSH